MSISTLKKSNGRGGKLAVSRLRKEVWRGDFVVDSLYRQQTALLHSQAISENHVWCWLVKIFRKAVSCYAIRQLTASPGLLICVLN